MPINNDVYGVWKLLKWTDTGLLGPLPLHYVVESANIGSDQQIENKPMVQGTALPLILNVGGASGKIEIKAPLLITKTPRSASRPDSVSDGFRLWSDLMGVGSAGMAYASQLMKSNYIVETGIIFENLSFEVSGRTGCNYTIGLRGDSNYFKEESGLAVGDGIELVNGSTIAGTTPVGVYDSGSYGPFVEDPDFAGRIMPMRLGSFYDVYGTISSGGTGVISGMMEQLSITYKFNTSGFNFVGQTTQRQIMGISGIEARFSGTMISATRSPLGYQFPWQAMNNLNDLVAGTLVKSPIQTYGGTVKTTSFSFDIRLRNGSLPSGGDISVVPGLVIDQSLFQSSTQQVSADLLRTNFSGFGWVTDPSPFS